MNGFQLDKNHIFRAYHFTMLDNLSQPDPNWKEPQSKEYIDVVSSLITHSLFHKLRVICGGMCKIRSVSISLQSKFKTIETARLQLPYIGPIMERIQATLRSERYVMVVLFI